MKYDFKNYLIIFYIISTKHLKMFLQFLQIAVLLYFSPRLQDFAYFQQRLKINLKTFATFTCWLHFQLNLFSFNVKRTIWLKLDSTLNVEIWYTLATQ